MRHGGQIVKKLKGMSDSVWLMASLRNRFRACCCGCLQFSASLHWPNKLSNVSTLIFIIVHTIQSIRKQTPHIVEGRRNLFGIYRKLFTLTEVQFHIPGGIIPHKFIWSMNWQKEKNCLEMELRTIDCREADVPQILELNLSVWPEYCNFLI